MDMTTAALSILKDSEKMIDTLWTDVEDEMVYDQKTESWKTQSLNHVDEILPFYFEFYFKDGFCFEDTKLYDINIELSLLLTTYEKKQMEEYQYEEKKESSILGTVCRIPFTFLCKYSDYVKQDNSITVVFPHKLFFNKLCGGLNYMTPTEIAKYTYEVSVTNGNIFNSILFHWNWNLRLDNEPKCFYFKTDAKNAIFLDSTYSEILGGNFCLHNITIKGQYVSKIIIEFFEHTVDDMESTIISYGGYDFIKIDRRNCRFKCSEIYEKIMVIPLHHTGFISALEMKVSVCVRRINKDTHIGIHAICKN